MRIIGRKLIIKIIKYLWNSIVRKEKKTRRKNQTQIMHIVNKEYQEYIRKLRRQKKKEKNERCI